MPHLPESLPEHAAFSWEVRLPGEGIGGIAVADDRVFVTSRDALDQSDMLLALDADNGSEIWRHSYFARGQLDYGNSPRAVPLVHDDLVFLLGAFGHLYCLEAETGIVLWQKNLPKDYDAPMPTWGFCGAPVIAEGKLIFCPGGPEAAIVAVDPETGETIWQSPGDPAAYASPVVFRHEQESLVGTFDSAGWKAWRVSDGKRIWSHRPKSPGDFNVPTANFFGDQLVLSSEGNGTRVFDTTQADWPTRVPVAVYEALAPDMHTPVVCGESLVGVCGGLHVLNFEDQFKTSHFLDDDAFLDYASLFTDGEKVLAFSSSGELILIAVNESLPEILSRLSLTDERLTILAHPAFANGALFARIGNTLCRLELGK